MNKKNVERVLSGKPEGKGTLGRHRRRWEENEEMCVREI
jgi:hypothetical protein